MDARETVASKEKYPLQSLEAAMPSQAIDRALASYEMAFQTDRDSGGSIRLVDILTPKCDSDISRGKQELELLADHIFNEIAPDARPVSDGELRKAVTLIDEWLSELDGSENNDERDRSRLEAIRAALSDGGRGGRAC